MNAIGWFRLIAGLVLITLFTVVVVYLRLIGFCICAALRCICGAHLKR